jgi:hypothetical protein
MQSNHPIPQNVTQYQFRLVGDMTLKQFLELAGGLLLAYLFYSSNLLFLFKYPLAISSVVLGFGLAFFPIEDRPLDVWIVNFIKAIYGPTRFIWSKTKTIPAIFEYSQQGRAAESSTVAKTIKAPTILSHRDEPPDYTPQESAQLDKLSALMQHQTISANTTTAEVSDRPEISVRKLSASPAKVAVPQVAVQASQPIPVAETKSEAESSLNSVNPQAFTSKGSVTAENITLPATPKTPNLVSGLVLDAQGKLVENAIVQIVDQEGIPKRAVKSNVLGQFMISTPLENGSFYLEIEHDTLEFPKVSLTLNGRVFAPIKVSAKLKST